MSFTTKNHMKSQTKARFKPIQKTDIPVVHKRPKVFLMSHEEGVEMKNLIEGGLMRKVTAPHMELALLEQGYICRATGGLVATEAGHKAFITWQKGGRK